MWLLQGIVLERSMVAFGQCISYTVAEGSKQDYIAANKVVAASSLMIQPWKLTASLQLCSIGHGSSKPIQFQERRVRHYLFIGEWQGDIGDEDVGMEEVTETPFRKQSATLARGKGEYMIEKI